MPFKINMKANLLYRYGFAVGSLRSKLKLVSELLFNAGMYSVEDIAVIANVSIEFVRQVQKEIPLEIERKFSKKKKN